MPWKYFYICLISLVIPYSLVQGQDLITKSEVESHVRFLASDELKGRKTGEQGADVAARYIAEQFRKYGVRPLNDSTGYFQSIPFKNVAPPDQVTLTLGDSLTVSLDDLVVRSQPHREVTAQVVFANFADEGDLEDLDLEGKIVLAKLGNEHTTSAQEGFAFGAKKRKLLVEKGASALIEIYHGRLPWNLIKNYLGNARTVIDGDADEASLTHLVVNKELQAMIKSLDEGADLQSSIQIMGGYSRPTPSANVVGLIEGSDSLLKDEHVVLSAHYDHVGTRKQPDRPETQFDSVFNGARDNAFGVAALLSAAQSLGAHPPKRSILLVAFTGEEIGLMGSKYFVDHPVVPLDQMIFNLNTDGAGYSDTSLISVMGLNRVGAKEELTKACNTFGFEAFADPAPNQGLFDRSDNVSFAAVGIPAPTFSPGFKDFDQAILKHYHQPSDEVSTLDFGYVHKFCQAFALAARLVADKSEQPRWSEGDKYEKAFEELFGK